MFYGREATSQGANRRLLTTHTGTLTFEPMDEHAWHYDYLDALRGIAVLGVIIVHASLNLRLGLIAAFLFAGQRGVQLFFIVSAFTLFLSHDNRRNERHPTLNFFLRRFFRIAPMFYLATALACLFAPDLAGPVGDVVLSLLFLHGITAHSIVHGAIAGWTIADEAIFYMLLPLLFRMIRSFTTALWWLVITIPVLYLSTQAIAHVSSPVTAEFATFFSFPVEFPIFLIGIAVYFFWKEKLKGRIKNQSMSRLFIASSLSLFCLALPSGNKTLYLSSLALALLVLGLSIFPWPILVNPFTRFVGRISFSVYLLHYYVLHFAQNVANRSALLVHHPLVAFSVLVLTTTTAIIPLSYLTFRLVEEPGRLLGKLLIATLENRSQRDSLEVAP